MKAHARTTDPRTSHEAAAGVDLARAQYAVLTFIKGRMPASFTDKDLVAEYSSHAGEPGVPPLTDSSIRSRRCELARRGHLEVVGTVNRTGRTERVWQVAA